MKKKILLVSNDGLGNGGVQAVIMSIVRNLNEKYTFDIVLFTKEERHYDREFCSYGGRIFRIPDKGHSSIMNKLNPYIRGLYRYSCIKKVIHTNGPYTAIHCNNEFEAGPLLKAAYKESIPIRIAHSHIINQKFNWLANIVSCWQVNLIEKYSTIKIGCTQAAYDSLYKNKINSIIINNAYNEKVFDPTLYCRTDNESLVLLQVGRICETKNQLFSVKIIENINKRGCNAKLILVGDSYDSYLLKIREYISNHNLSEIIELLPGNSNIPELLAHASAFLCPSLNEGFGIVLIEAQAMGVVCYASSGVPADTNCGGVKYIDLDKGVAFWTEMILSDFRETDCTFHQYDVSRFKTKTIINKFDDIYSSN